jgi:hypothetical protein
MRFRSNFNFFFLLNFLRNSHAVDNKPISFQIISIIKSHFFFCKSSFVFQFFVNMLCYLIIDIYHLTLFSRIFPTTIEFVIATFKCNYIRHEKQLFLFYVSYQ